MRTDVVRKNLLNQLTMDVSQNANTIPLDDAGGPQL